MTTEGTYDVFVSHAWEDKADFVKPLVDRLVEMGLRVWYDELSLDLGDSLRENIDRGLALSLYGVVVLSSVFFSKRWPQRELNGLVQKAMGEGRKVILPVWHGVNRQDVADYSLPLADLVAARSDEGVNIVAESIARVIRGQGGTEDAENRLRSHQLAEQRLLSTAKRMIADPTQVVGIHELADALSRDAYVNLRSSYETALQGASDLNVAALFAGYRQAMRSVLSFCALAANLGDPAHFPSVGRVVSIFTRYPGEPTGQRLDEGLWHYPSALMLYSIGLCALQKGRLTLLRHVLLDIQQADRAGRDRTPIIDYIHWDEISRCTKTVYRPNETTTYKTPLSEHLFQELPALVGSYFVDDYEFEHVFDVFEYILGLASACTKLRSGQEVGWPPTGRYLWKNGFNGQRIVKLRSEAEKLGALHVLFDGHNEWLDAAANYLEKWSQNSVWR